MNNILRDLIDTGDVVAFIDNVLVGTKDRKHNKIVEKVLKRIEKNNLYIKLEKYAWKVKEIDFLGLVMKTEEIKIQKEKVARVLEWPRPKTVKKIQKFLGLANYYRQFVKDFAKLAKPLHKLVKKDEKWNWKEEQEVAFKELKRMLTIRPVLVASNLNKEIRVEVNILEYTTEGVLLIKCENKKWRPVAFISKLLNKTERNYEIHHREILTIIRCFKKVEIFTKRYTRQIWDLEQL